MLGSWDLGLGVFPRQNSSVLEGLVSTDCRRRHRRHVRLPSGLREKGDTIQWGDNSGAEKGAAR